MYFQTIREDAKRQVDGLYETVNKLDAVYWGLDKETQRIMDAVCSRCKNIVKSRCVNVTTYVEVGSQTENQSKTVKEEKQHVMDDVIAVLSRHGHVVLPYIDNSYKNNELDEIHRKLQTDDHTMADDVQRNTSENEESGSKSPYGQELEVTTAIQTSLVGSKKDLHNDARRVKQMEKEVTSLRMANDCMGENIETTKVAHCSKQVNITTQTTGKESGSEQEIVEHTGVERDLCDVQSLLVSNMATTAKYLGSLEYVMRGNKRTIGKCWHRT